MNILEMNFLIITISAVIFQYLFRNKLSKNIFLYFSFLLMFLVNVLRYPLIGTDMGRYYRHYINIGMINSLDSFLNYDHEIGFKTLQFLVSHIFNNFQIYIVIVGVIIFSSYAFYIRKYSVNYYLSIFFFITLGFYDFSFSGLRQAIAMAISLYAYNFAIKKKLKLFILATLLASLFHITAIVILPIYFLINYQLKRRDILFIIPSFVLFYLFRMRIGAFFNLLYYDSTETMYNSSDGFSGMAFLLIVIIILGFILESPFSEKSDKKMIGFLNVLITAAFIQVISTFAYSFTRLNYFYLLSLIIYMPQIMALKTSKCIYFDKKIEFMVKILFTIFILTYFSIAYLNSLTPEGSNVLPYSFFWNIITY